MQQPIRMVVARHVRSLDTSGPGHRPRPIPFFVRRHRAYAPMVLPCMRADAVLMLLPTISSNSLDSARSDSTASQGASLDAKGRLGVVRRDACRRAQQLVADMSACRGARQGLAVFHHRQAVVNRPLGEPSRPWLLHLLPPFLSPPCPFGTFRPRRRPRRT